MSRPTQATIDLAALRHNVGIVRPSRKENSYAVTYALDGDIHHSVVEVRRLGLTIVDADGEEQVFSDWAGVMDFLKVRGLT